MLQFDHDKELNYVLNLEKKIINVPKDLNDKEEITLWLITTICTLGSPN